MDYLISGASMCATGHPKIWHKEKECPLCKAEAELGKKEYEATQLEGTIDSLRTEIQGYAQ
jgi:hypothetical protein